MDMKEGCVREEDRRSVVFRDKIFQRFSLFYYYSDYLATQANKMAERVKEQEKIILNYRVLTAGQET